jgi:hypothetical protein
MRNFLLYLAGARPDILEQVPSERSRFLGLGSSVLAAGVFIGAVAAVAFIQIGVNAALASIYGCLIGLVFLGLDSRLVAPTTRGRRVFAATPRVLLALLCGATFAAAIAIGSLRPEIDQQITVIEQRAEAKFLQLQSTSPLDKEIITLQSESNNLRSIIDTGGATALNPSSDATLVSLDKQLNQAQAAETSAFENLQCQLYGISANGNKCVAGSGPLAQAAQQQYDADANQVNKLHAQISDREEQLQSSNVNAQRSRVAEAEEQLPGVDAELAKDEQTLATENVNFTANNNDNGLLGKLQALGELSDNNSSIRYYTLFYAIFVLLDKHFAMFSSAPQDSAALWTLRDCARSRAAARGAKDPISHADGRS